MFDIINNKTKIQKLNNCTKLNDNCNDCDFSGIDFIKCKIKNKNFNHSFFENCVFENVLFENIDLEHIEFDESEFKNCIFINCKFNASDFIYNTIINVKFINCDFSSGEWRNVKLENSIFKNCNFTDTTVTLCEFNNCIIDNNTKKTLKGKEKNYNIFIYKDTIFINFNNKLHSFIDEENNVKLKNILLAIKTILELQTKNIMALEFIINILKNFIDKYATLIQIYFIHTELEKLIQLQNNHNIEYFSKLIELLVMVRNKIYHIETLLEKQYKIFKKIELIDYEIKIKFNFYLTKEEVLNIFEFIKIKSYINLKVEKIEYGSTIITTCIEYVAEASALLIAFNMFIKNLNISIDRITNSIKSIKNLKYELQPNSTNIFNIELKNQDIKEIILNNPKIIEQFVEKIFDEAELTLVKK